MPNGTTDAPSWVPADATSDAPDWVPKSDAAPDWVPKDKISSDIPKTEAALNQSREAMRPKVGDEVKSGLMDIVKGIPGMVKQIPELGYQAVKFQTGGPQQQADVIGNVLSQGVQQGGQLAKDVQSPVGSREWTRGAAQLGLMALPGFELAKELMPEVPIAKPPLQPEPPPTVSLGPGTTAADVTAALEPTADINRELAPEQPTAPSIEQATEPAPKIRQPLSLDELRLMREKNDLQLQNDIAQRATGATHPAVDDRINQIDEELTNIANRELQPEGEPPDAIQEPSTGEILQRQPQEAGGAGSQRGRMESGVQGQETTGASQSEPVPPGESVVTATPETNGPQSLTAELPQTTALKNEITAAERETRDLSPREQVEKRSWDQAKAIADQQAATDPSKGARLVEELNQTPRPLDDIEGVHLLRRKVEVNAEHDAAIKALNANPDDVNAIARFKNASDEAQKVYNAAEASGTSWGRGGRIRQAMMAEDYSLGTMANKTRALANKGKPLADAQLGDVVSHYEKISKQAARIKSIENDLQSPNGKMQPTEILKAIEEMKQRLAPCL